MPEIQSMACDDFGCACACLILAMLIRVVFCPQVGSNFASVAHHSA
jgi:hypothetical protein